MIPTNGPQKGTCPWVMVWGVVIVQVSTYRRQNYTSTSTECLCEGPPFSKLSSCAFCRQGWSRFPTQPLKRLLMLHFNVNQFSSSENVWCSLMRYCNNHFFVSSQTPLYLPLPCFLQPLAQVSREPYFTDTFGFGKSFSR